MNVDERGCGVSRREFAFAAFPFFWRPRRVEMVGVRFRVLKKGEDRRHFVWIHGNETTAGEVLREHMRHRDGRAFLVENGRRNVPVAGGELDPNRMWSREGAEKNLVTLNPLWNFEQLQAVLDTLDRERQHFLDKLLPQRGELLIALHNNSPSYSVNEEVPISDATSIKQPDRPRAFLLCTDSRDYEVLARGPYNVVLQNRAPKEDDGSLSRLAASRRVRYLNIECPLGDAASQREILGFAETLPEHL